MKLQNVFAILATICILQVPQAGAADKKMTTYERQVNLMKRVNDGQKSKELTERQAKSLRKDLSKIAVSKQKIRDAKPGKNQSENRNDVEENLTEISEKMEKYKRDNIENKD